MTPSREERGRHGRSTIDSGMREGLEALRKDNRASKTIWKHKKKKGRTFKHG